MATTEATMSRRLGTLLYLGACALAACAGNVGGPPPSPDGTTTPDVTDERSLRDDAPAPAPDAVTPDAPPAPPAALRVVFPLPGGSASPTIVVRGTTDGLAVARVTVHGVAATLSDQNRRWRAEVPLAMGRNALDVVLERTDGARGSAEVAVERFADEAAIRRGGNALFSSYRVMTLGTDETGAAVYILDDIHDGVVRVNLATGDHTWVTCEEAVTVCQGGGHGEPVSQALGVVVFVARNEAFLIDGASVLRVDTTTHDRALVSGAGRGAGPLPVRLGSMAYDAARGRVIALDWMTYQIFAIDIATGNRTVLASDSVGTGPSTNGFLRIALDADHGQLLATRSYQNTIYTVRLTDGTRGTAPAGSGAAFVEPGWPVMGPTGTLFVWSEMSAQVLAARTDTFERRVVASATVGSGPRLGGVTGLVYTRDVLVAFDSMRAGVVAIDPEEGHRIVVSR
jgi:hypothetical protein